MIELGYQIFMEVFIMKKIIALVLTVMMIASTLAVGVSAVRSYDYEVTVRTNKALYTNEGVQLDCGDFNFSDGYVVSMDVMFASEGMGCYANWGFNGVYIHQNKGVGVGDNNHLDFTFEVGKWYNVRYVLADGGTDIYVNDVKLGRVDVQFNRFITGFEGTYFDNMYVIAYEGSQKFGTDFESYEVGSVDSLKNGKTIACGGASIRELDIPATNKALYTFEGVQLDCGDFNFGDGYVVKMDVMFAEEGLGCYANWGFKGVYIHQSNGVGVGDNDHLDYTFNVGEWYSVRYELLNGATDVYVNNEKVGTVAVQFNRFITGFEKTYFDNIYVFAPGYNQKFGTDFESYDAGSVDSLKNGKEIACGGASVVELETGALDINILYNKNSYDFVQHHDAVYDGKALYFANDGKWPDGSSESGQAYVYVKKMFDDSYIGNAIMSVDVCAIAEGANTGGVAYLGLPAGTGVTYDYGKQQIGVGGVMIPLDTPWKLGEWHNVIIYSSFGDVGSVIMVDGALLSSSGSVVAGANAKFGNAWCCGATNMGFDNIKIWACDQTVNQFTTGELLYEEDFEDGVWQAKQSDGNGRILDKLVTPAYDTHEYVEKDLGARYIALDGYSYIDGAKEPAVWEFDYSPAADSESGAIWAGNTAPALFVDKIGVNNETVPYEFKAGEWYHIVLDGTVGGTDIYVDGVKVGHVDTAIEQYWCGPAKASIDNLKVGDKFEDAEDGNVGGVFSDSAATAKYEFPPKTIFDYIETSAPGGEAYLVKGGYDYELGKVGADNDSDYFDMTTGVNPGASEYIINLDLALIPETDTTGETYFEIWSDVASRRWAVGVASAGFRGGDNTLDVKAFDWGEATKDNFHNITYVFKNGEASIYIDKNLVYTGTSGKTWDNMMIGNVYNGSAILDNVQLFTFSPFANSLDPKLVAKETRMARDEDVKVIDLDAEDFCAANGHIQHHTERTTEPFCETTGVDTTYCAICGGVAKTTTVPALGHSYPGYYSATTVDGVRTFACRRGCGKTWSTTVPTPVAGRLDLFLDFADAEVVQKIADIFNGDKEVVEDGIGKFQNGSEQNYNQFTINDSSLRNQYTVAFDFKVNGLFDTDATEGYGHGVWFWFGGDSGIANEAGYDFEKNEFFVRPSGSAAYEEIRAAAKISKDTWHQLMFKVYAPGEESEENWMKIYLDGEEVLVFDEWYDTTYYLPTTQNFCIIRDFGVAADIDNFAVGSIDLELTAKRNVGDLTGDTKITTKDLKVLKLALAGKYTLNAAEETAADINGDGKINLDDLAAMKRLLAGA